MNYKKLGYHEACAAAFDCLHMLSYIGLGPNVASSENPRNIRTKCLG